VKRLYFLAAIAAMQIILGSFTMLGAAQPVRMSQDVFIPSGAYYPFDFGILGTGRLSGSLSERQGLSLDFFVFDDRGYASFRDGSNAVPPLFEQSGTTIVFNLDLPGSGEYHAVAADSASRQERRVYLDLVVVGLKPIESVVAVIVLAGGLALVGAALMLSVWSSRQAPQAPSGSPDPPSDPSPDPLPDPREAAQEPADDNTRLY
jgi:hypothetical protein